MIGYVTLGTNDFERGVKFYDELLATIGAKRVLEFDRGISWAVSPTTPGLALVKPFDGKPASVGNGVMVALVVNERAKVDALYAKAMSLGASDAGAPGDRGGGFYAAYFRDLDGNKLNVFCFG